MKGSRLVISEKALTECQREFLSVMLIVDELGLEGAISVTMALIDETVKLSADIDEDVYTALIDKYVDRLLILDSFSYEE